MLDIILNSLKNMKANFKVKKEYTGNDQYSYMEVNDKVGYSQDGNVEVKSIYYIDENENTVLVYSVSE